MLAFTHLTNNYGFTGDWYINDIRDLEAGPSFQWFRHAFAPSNVFIDLADQRYFPNGNYSPRQKLDFKLVGINDNAESVSGRVELLLLDSGNKTIKRIRYEITIPAYGRKDVPVSLKLPSGKGGYLITTGFKPTDGQQILRSRRYIRIGDSEHNLFPVVKP